MSSRGVKVMKQIFPSMCMLTAVKTELTYHHLDKKADGGKVTIENGALLNTHIHMWLHNYVERNNPILYEEIKNSIIQYKEALLENNKELIEYHVTQVMPFIINLYNCTEHALKGFVQEDDNTYYKRIRKKYTNNKEEQ